MINSRSLSKLRAAPRKMVSAAGRLWQIFARDLSGIAAIEFAILFPTMIMVYIGSIEITDGYMVKRKVASTTSAIGDLIARYKTINKSEMETILDAAQAVASPYPADLLRIKVTGVWIDKNLEAKVVWGVARNDTPDQRDAVIDLSDGVKKKESFLVIANVETNYTPTVGFFYTGDVSFRDMRVYLRPRVTGGVCYDGKCGLS